MEVPIPTNDPLGVPHRGTTKDAQNRIHIIMAALTAVQEPILVSQPDGGSTTIRA